MKNNVLGRLLRLAFLLLLTCAAPLVQAQLSRSISNPSFEDPLQGTRAATYNSYFATAVDWVWLDKGEIPGWETTHPIVTCPAGSGAVGVAAYNCNAIELWYNNFNGTIPAQGRVLAELNANQASKIYQNVCIKPGDAFTFNFAHRGRSGVDEARFELTSLPILSFQTGNTTGVAGTITVVGAGTTGASRASIANGWTRYSGTYTYTGATSLEQLGFVAVSAAGGIAAGNFIDDVNITLKPYTELNANTFSVEGSPMAQVPQIRFVGVIATSTPMTVTFTSTAADYGVDYDFTGPSILTGVAVNYNAATRSGTLTFNVPAGNYTYDAGNVLINLPLNILDDTAIENNEVINFFMPASTLYPFTVGNTMTCAGAPTTSITHTIIDNDISLRTTKSVSATTTTLGGTLGYTVTFANVTPPVSVSLAPLTAHDAVGVSVADTVPASATFTSWTCSASGGAACPSASGTGSIAGTATIPAGGSLLYAVSAVVPSDTASCGSSITNTATQAISASTLQPVNGAFPVGTLSRGVTLQGSAGFVVQPLQATVTTQIVACTSLNISKTDSTTTVAAGSTVGYAITASNTGSFAADGALVLDTPSAGLLCTAATCAVGSGAAVCPVATPAAMASALLTAPGLPIATFPGGSSLVFTLECGVTAGGG